MNLKGKGFKIALRVLIAPVLIVVASIAAIAVIAWAISEWAVTGKEIDY